MEEEYDYSKLNAIVKRNAAAKPWINDTPEKPDWGLRVMVGACFTLLAGGLMYANYRQIQTLQEMEEKAPLYAPVDPKYESPLENRARENTD